MSRTQWHVLAASAAINWSTYFIHDVPASLSTPLSEHLSLPDQQYAYLVSLLYAVYAVPNTVLPFFAGPAVQRFGERSVLLGTISSIVTGQLLFALSVAIKFQLGMIAGRAFIGLGGEMVGVIGCAIVTRWFQGKRFTLALAINLCAGRLGSVANTIVIPRLIGLYGIVPATWIATALSLSVVPISTAFLLSVSRPKAVAVIDESERPLLRPATGDTDDSSVNSIKGGSSKGTSFIITLLPPVYWQLALMCVLSYGCLNTFANSAQRFIASQFYAGDQRAAGSAMSIPYILSGFLVPLFGLVLDKLSSRGYPRALITSNMFLVFAHGIFLARATATPVLPLCLLGIGDALLCVSFWASVVRCLLQVETGTGTGTGTETETKTEIETETIVHGKTPSLQNDNINNPEDDLDKLGCEPILSSRDLDPDLESEDRAGNSAAARGEVIRTLGLGVMTSLMSASAAVVPLLLAMMEGVAGLSGLEIVFVVLAALGCLAAVRLAWMFH